MCGFVLTFIHETLLNSHLHLFCPTDYREIIGAVQRFVASRTSRCGTVTGWRTAWVICSFHACTWSDTADLFYRAK